MNKFLSHTSALALALSAAFSAHANDSDFSCRFSGFGTAGYGQTNSNDMLFINPGQLKGGDNSGSDRLDSRIAGQLDLTVSNKLRATVQALAMHHAKAKFSPQPEWAFLRHKLSDDTSVRSTQRGSPAYLVSEFDYVGYANPGVGTPIDAYNLAPPDKFQRTDLTWSHSMGNGYLNLQGLAGHASRSLPDDGTVTAQAKDHQFAGAYATSRLL
jgi:hypothetical protein